MLGFKDKTAACVALRTSFVFIRLASPSLWSQLDRFCSGSMCGNVFLPHCSQALIVTACQWASFFSARSPCKRNTLCCDIKGVMRCTPSSVAFSTNQSMRSLAGITTAKCTWWNASRSMVWCAPTITRTSCLPICSITASNSPPAPLNNVIVWPGCIRNTCTWRAAVAGNAMEAPVCKACGQ